jgi:urease accessory protein UreF
MRYECTEPGFEGAFLEFSAQGWTRKELHLLRTLEESDAWFALLRGKLTAYHLPTVTGGALEAFDSDGLDLLDLVLYNWFVTAVIEAVRDVTNLGNAPWRRLSAARETATATTSPTQP